MSAIFARPRTKGKGEIHKRVENRRLSTLLPTPRGAATFPPSTDGEIPRLISSEKPPAR